MKASSVHRAPTYFLEMTETEARQFLFACGFATGYTNAEGRAWGTLQPLANAARELEKVLPGKGAA